MTKRIVDLVVATVALGLGAPILGAAAIAVRLVHGSPMLFRQLRTGRGGREFEILKLRTMKDTRDAAGELLPDDERQSRLGMSLRKTSIDELPELLNVLRGEMSIVGPRPLLPEYVPLYSAHQSRRLEVKPGITGWAQVNGRNALSWEEKFDLDVWYVDNQSMLLDLRILFKTVQTVLQRDGISADGTTTAPRFTGTAPKT